MATPEKTPQQILDMQERRKGQPFWVLPTSGIFPGIYGNPTLVKVAVMTEGNTLREATETVENERPDSFVDAYARALQRVLVPDYPQTEGITVGKFHLTPHGSTEFSASVQLVRNGDIYVSSAKGPNEHQALQNAITDGFRQVIIR